MEIAAVAYDATESLASAALRGQRKAAQEEQLAARIYDSTNISAEARKLSQLQRGDNSGASADPEGDRMQESLQRDHGAGEDSAAEEALGESHATGKAAEKNTGANIARTSALKLWRRSRV